MKKKKDLKFNIKNSQIAEAIQLDKLKKNLLKKKDDEASRKLKKSPVKRSSLSKKSTKKEKADTKKEVPRRKARSKSVFSDVISEQKQSSAAPLKKISEEKDPVIKKETQPEPTPPKEVVPEKKEEKVAPLEKEPPVRLGPTGKHIKDLLLKQKRPKPKSSIEEDVEKTETAPKTVKKPSPPKEDIAPKKPAEKDSSSKEIENEDSVVLKGKKGVKGKDQKENKPFRKQFKERSFDARDRHGFREVEEDIKWRKKRPQKQEKQAKQEEKVNRPTSLKVPLPISIKDLASMMKLKSSQLIAKLFLQGITLTINDFLDDEVTLQLLGEEFGCTITPDHSERKRISITEETIGEEIKSTKSEKLSPRPPVIAFMGHVDHGKTSLIDYIRKSNIVSGEAGKITQHMGAFSTKTSHGMVTILDTPGHEAFSAMRERGADVTDIIILVIAGNEGIKVQTTEAIKIAKETKKPCIVAINKSDVEGFDPENVYRQLADQELLPEAWGGQTITVNCSAKTGEGINQLLEMVSLQAEIMELQANKDTRARGTVIESELHKGLGAVVTLLVQNGTLNLGDALVFDRFWAKIRVMKNEFDKDIQHVSPAFPAKITGLSGGLPDAGEEFIVVSNEKDAKDIANTRKDQARTSFLQQQKKGLSFENKLQRASEKEKKVFQIILKADVQGSLEAMASSLQKIESDKIEIHIISSGVGEISESDVELAQASNAVIIGYLTNVESHAESLIKQSKVVIKTYDVIYHATEDVKKLMVARLDKIEEENKHGAAEVIAVFKSSQLGLIAGCKITEGEIKRTDKVRLFREGEEIWKGNISSLKRLKDDVKTVQKGMECGILFDGFKEAQVGDTIEAFDITYLTQTL